MPHTVLTSTIKHHWCKYEMTAILLSKQKPVVIPLYHLEADFHVQHKVKSSKVTPEQATKAHRGS
jgi:hypothetical protein